MTFIELMHEHPLVTAFLGFCALCVLEYPLKLINRWIRHRNIVAKGWPPAHLDADGDWQKDRPHD